MAQKVGNVERQLAIHKAGYLKSAALAIVMGFPTLALADEAAVGATIWQLQLSPYTKHYKPSPEHKPVYLIGIERLSNTEKFWGGDQSLLGLNYFSNSFGQPSAYAYGGGVYQNLFNSPNLYFKWTAGILYGYKPPYQDKVPFNKNGWSPGLVAGLGYKITPQMGVQLNALGFAAVMLSFNYTLR